VAIGDFNADGKLDLAVANYGSNTVSVLLNASTPKTAVLISSLEARTSRDRVDLYWYASDAAAAVFQVQRAVRAAGPYAAVGSEIRGVVDRSAYSFTDRSGQIRAHYFYRIECREGATIQYAGPIEVSMPGARFGLWEVGPSPAARDVRITYELDRADPAAIEVFDLSGRCVRRLETSGIGAGRYAVTWDGTDRSGQRLAAGIYFIRLRSGAQVSVRRVVVVR
jgi:hypothetical protein